MERVQRYTWEDSLIEAQRLGVISNGDLLVALKLARAINWQPKDKRQPGLYWANEQALEAVGCGRSTYFKHRKSLLETGYFITVKNNLIPRVPESHRETIESTAETSESLGETEKSLGDNPFSVDIYSVDICSDDLSSKDKSAVVVPPTASFESLPKGDKELQTSTTLLASIEPPALLPQDETPVFAKATEGAPVHSVNQVPQRMTLRDIALSRSPKMPVREEDEW
jgi:hypothetical protein